MTTPYNNASTHEDYEQDYNLWLQKNVALLRQGKINHIDAANIAEELESMGKRDRRQLLNRAIVLLAHLIKWAYQPDAICSSWEGTIIEQRRRLLQLLKDSPSLKPLMEQQVSQAWEAACKDASVQTGQPVTTYPQQCPWGISQILDADWFPEG